MVSTSNLKQPDIHLILIGQSCKFDDIEEDSDEDMFEEVNARDYVHLDEPFEYQNYVFCFGCEPSYGVKADTKMVLGISYALLHRFDRDSMICEFPAVLDGLKGKDCNFEMVTSTTIQSVNLFYHNNYAEKTIGVVFVNTQLLNRDDNTMLKFLEKNIDALERGETARQLFKSSEMLDLGSVEVCTDYTKVEIQDKFEELQKIADDFEAEDGQVLGIFVYYIGYRVTKWWH